MPWKIKCSKISQALKGREFSDEHKSNISKARSGRKISQEHKDKISKKLKGKRLGRESTGWGKPPGHGKRIWYTTNDGINICMRSTWEVRVADSLTALGIKWVYEPKRFTLRDRTYLPDFYLPELGVWYEVKGWLHERHQETIRQFREMYSEETIIVATKHVLKMLENACVE